MTVSACGGDDSPEVPIIVPTDSTTGSLAKADFIKEADALCRETNAAIGRFVASGEGFTASGEIGDLREALAKDIQDLFLSGKRADAFAAVPDDYVDRASLTGDEGRVRERIAVYKEVGVTYLDIAIPEGTEEPLTVIEKIKAWAE